MDFLKPCLPRRDTAIRTILAAQRVCIEEHTGAAVAYARPAFRGRNARHFVTWPPAAAEADAEASHGRPEFHRCSGHELSRSFLAPGFLFAAEFLNERLE
jgi:hypothetical protein